MYNAKVNFFVLKVIHVQPCEHPYNCQKMFAFVHMGLHLQCFIRNGMLSLWSHSNQKRHHPTPAEACKPMWTNASVFFSALPPFVGPVDPNRLKNIPSLLYYRQLNTCNSLFLFLTKQIIFLSLHIVTNHVICDFFFYDTNFLSTVAKCSCGFNGPEYTEKRAASCMVQRP